MENYIIIDRGYNLLQFVYSAAVDAVHVCIRSNIESGLDSRSHRSLHRTKEKPAAFTNYLLRSSFRSKVIVLTHERARTHTHTHNRPTVLHGHYTNEHETFNKCCVEFIEIQQIIS